MHNLHGHTHSDLMDPPSKDWVKGIPKLLQLDGSPFENSEKLEKLEKLVQKRLEKSRASPKTLDLAKTVVYRYNKYMATKGVSKRRGHPDSLMVEPFGSVVMGTATMESDVDLSLEGSLQHVLFSSCI